jgi:methyl-accepting chemotaxis protein
MKEKAKGSWFANLNLKPKMLYGIGAIMAMFVLVIGMYQYTLNTTSLNIKGVLNNEIAIQELAADINVEMLQARRNEKDFIIRKDLKYLPAHAANVEKMIANSTTLKGVAEEIGNEQFM